MENKESNEESRFFISYASEDRPKVKEYEQALIHNGLKVWLDQQKIHFSDSIVSEINAGIEGSKYALIFYSNYYKSKVWTQEEMAALIFAAVSSEAARKIFVIRLDNTELPALLAHRLWSGNTEPQNFAQTLSVLIKEETEKTTVPPTSVSENKRIEKIVNLATLDDNTCIILAKTILKNNIDLGISTFFTVKLSIGNKPNLFAEVWKETLSYDLTADLKSWLDIINTHNEYIKDFREELAEGVLGKFKAGFRLAMEKRMVDRDAAQNEVRSYLEVVCKKIYEE